MRILLVDDDENKAREISAFVTAEFPHDALSIRRSYQSGLKEILVSPPDVVLLDMTMPNYDVGPRESGGRERRYAGKEVLRQIERRHISLKAIVVTQYEQFEEDGIVVTLKELVQQLESDFPSCFLGAVFYQAANTAWMDELRLRLTECGGRRE